MTKKLFKLPILGMLFVFMGVLFLSTDVFADELDTPADDPIIEEDTDIVYSNYYNSYGNGVYLYNNSTYNPYEEFYLRSEDYYEFEEFIEDNNYNAIAIDYYVRINHTQNATSAFSIQLYNWHNSPLIYTSTALGINSTGNYTYHFSLHRKLSDMSNSLCFKYAATYYPQIIEAYCYISYTNTNQTSSQYNSFTFIEFY